MITPPKPVDRSPRIRAGPEIFDSKSWTRTVDGAYVADVGTMRVELHDRAEGYLLRLELTPEDWEELVDHQELRGVDGELDTPDGDDPIRFVRADVLLFEPLG